MGLFRLLKILNSGDTKSNDELDKEMDRYHLNKEEKENDTMSEMNLIKMIMVTSMMNK